MVDSQELDIELVLDRIAGQLDAELRLHVQAFARAYAEGSALPSAPDLAGRASTAAVGRRALAFPPLKPRAVALLRLVAPLLIERDGGVATARAGEPTWAGLRALIEARDAVANARFKRRAIDVLHRLAGAPEAFEPTTAQPGPIAGWTEIDHVLEDRAVDDAWRFLGEPSGLEILRSDMARPRYFAVEDGGRGIAVIPRVIDTPAKRFAVLHELGHALLHLSVPRAWPRAIDEAGASCIARLMEAPDRIPGRWYSPLATAARARRTQLARVLDTVERRLHEPVDPPVAKPPWALWHDPAAQAAYVAAEAIADELGARFGSPSPPRVVEELAQIAAQIDRDLVL